MNSTITEKNIQELQPHTILKISKMEGYKIELSNKNPEHSRMLFELEYIQKFKTNEHGKVTDTIFALIVQEFRNEIKKLKRTKLNLIV